MSRTLINVPYTERELRVAAFYALRRTVLRIPRNPYPVPRVTVAGDSWRCPACGRAQGRILAWQEGTRPPRDPFMGEFRMLADVCAPCRDKHLGGSS